MKKLYLDTLFDSIYLDLSDGQQRKVLIARALIHSPLVLILDEPFIGLDIKGRYSVNDCISNLSKEGVTILQVTNNLDDINNITDRLVCIKSGRIFKEGKPSDILNSETISELYETPITLIKSNGYWRTFPKN